MISPQSIGTRGYINRNPLSIATRGYIAGTIIENIILGIGVLISYDSNILGSGFLKQLTLEIKRMFTVSIKTMSSFTSSIASKLKFKVDK